MKHLGTVELYRDRLFLRRFREDDYISMYKNWGNDPEVTKYLTWPTYRKVEDALPVVKSWISQYDKKDFYQWAIVIEGSFEVIGSISVVNFDETTKTAEIGYCIGQEWWHQGYTKRALARVIDFLFNEVEVENIEVKHDVNNPHSGGVALKCGLHYIETLVKAETNNQGLVDVALYRLSRNEYLASQKPVGYDFKVLTDFLDIINEYQEHQNSSPKRLMMKVFSALKSACSGYPTFGLPNHYATILKQQKIEIEEDNLADFDIKKMNAQTVLAFMLGVYNSERYYDDIVLNALSEGIFSQCLTRLKELSETDE